MNSFYYKGGVFQAEEVPVRQIAEQVGTPAYIYSTAAFRENFLRVQRSLNGLDHLICYAMKANSNQAVLKILAELGSGFDVVSIGEYYRAKAAGAPGEVIVFSGVGKTREEMRIALEGGIRHFNVESEPELEALDAVARSLDLRAPVAIRVNPGVDARTHKKITTGKSENKFGIPISRAREVYRKASAMEGIVTVGVDMHIGSQLVSLSPFQAAFRKIAGFVTALRSDGHSISRIDLGGGLGIAYEESADPPSVDEYCDLLKRETAHLGCEIEIEPGRIIAANAGILISTALYLKQGEDREFLILDAAMNDLLRPAMYDAHHCIVPAVQPKAGSVLKPVDVVGPVCESSDTFARQRLLPPLSPGDLFVFKNAGAYGAVMASEYNTRPLAPEVLVHGKKFSIVRKRPDLDSIIFRDKIPDWL